MRLPSDERLALETIAAAVESGITVFDTARAYDGNERLLAGALRGVPSARLVTKGGMRREGGAWIPDGRAKSIHSDCEASLADLDGQPIDLYLLHAPDPRTPWRTSVRALARLADEGLVRHIGVANVTRDQLDEAVELAPVAAVQVALSLLDDRALRGGVVERCAELGVALLAHSPLGGPRRAPGLLRRAELVDVAAAHGASPGEAALAWLLGISPNVIAIPGARRPDAARSAARAATLALDAERHSGSVARSAARSGRPIPSGDGGRGGRRHGHSGRRQDAARRGVRDRGLRAPEPGRARRLVAGARGGAGRRAWQRNRRVVLDNTYLSRASRSHVIDAARRHGAACAVCGSTPRLHRRR